MLRSSIAARALLALLLMFAPQAALGQDAGATGALRLPAMDRPLGLQGGGFVFVPSLGLTYGYDSNVFYEADTAFESPNSAQILIVKPGVSVHNRNVENISLEVDGSAEIRRYLSGNDAVSEQSNVAGSVGVKAQFFRRAAVSLELEERFKRALERRNVETSRNFNRHVNRVGGAVTFAPGGRALQVRGSYYFVYDLFTDTVADWGDLVRHDIGLAGTWKFFPFTTAVLDIRWQIRDYVADGGGYYGELTDSKPLWMRAGLSGFITKKLSVTALAGWGLSLHDSRQLSAEEQETTPDAAGSYSGPIAEVRLGLRFDPTSIAQLGYTYSFRDSVFSNYAVYHRLSLNGQKRLFGRLDLIGDLSYSYISYAQLPRSYLYNTTQPNLEGLTTGYERVDGMLAFQLSANLDIARYLAAEVSYRLEVLNNGLSGSDFGIEFADGYVDTIGYTRHIVMASLILRY